MTASQTPLEGYIAWLPGELAYSARKAGYDEKIERARLPLDNHRSVYGFLETEWHNFQQLRTSGVHYKPFHGMSAQLQLVKFSAGIFDKVGMARWLASETPATEENFVHFASEAAAEIIEARPWAMTESRPDLLYRPFEATPFAGHIQSLMNGIVRASELSGAERQAEAARITDEAMKLGGLAVSGYLSYAAVHLRPEQWSIPASQLAT